MELMPVGTKVDYFSAISVPAEIIEHRINRTAHGIWKANSYYVIRDQSGAIHTIDLIDAHETCGGVLKPRPFVNQTAIVIAK